MLLGSHQAGSIALRETSDKRTHKKYLLEILLKWQNLFWKTTFLSLIQMYINRFQVLLLGQTLHHLLGNFYGPIWNQIFRESKLKTSSIVSLHWWRTFFNEHFLNLGSWFLKRGYPEKIIDTEMSKFKFNVDNKRSSSRQKKRIPFLLTFHPKLKVFQNIINKHLYLLYMNDDVKRAFTAKLMVSSRSFPKISSFLVRSKLYPIERTVGSFRCGSKRCEICKYIT